ncbi:MAG: enoyl-CoA hydratase/isomerase family protein [Gammaproteobacteria bacterium]|nr:enoyl-CoA hydratase/isomerase family protein [Gammaproteobacteria bacterium]
MSANLNFQHWRLEERHDAALVSLDVSGQSANVLSAAVLEEFARVLTHLETTPYSGAIIRSAKPHGFIVGADVTEFQKITDADRAAELARTGQRLFDRIEALPYPTVAVIHGNCLGGGLELALACTYRVAREDEGTRLGLPEVRLGIHPGFGGSVRLPRLIGHLPALDLMLTGRAVSSRAARRLGLVDECVPERHLLRAAHALIDKAPAPHQPGVLARAPGLKPLRPLVAKLLAHKLRAKASPAHYPAPYRILELWRNAAGYADEAQSLGQLLVSRTSHNLVRVFLLGEELKRRGRKAAHSIERVHVIGAGVMGADIAAWTAFKGFQVSLQDRSPEALARAMKKAHGYFSKRLKQPRAVQAAMDRLMPDPNGHGLARADLVIEAIVENVEAKRGLFLSVDRVAKADALLATNTSSIPLEELAGVLRDPGRLVGLHFFNPVAQMQLVEIVRGAQSSAQALERARGFTSAIERLPLDVKSSPGFLVNRILMPYLLEAVTMVDEGVPIAAIDRAAVEFGMPMGPILLADTVGIDICLSVAEELSGPLGVAVPTGLRDMVGRGDLGKKTGRGFYRYDKRGRPRPLKGEAAGVPIAERLILRMLNEAKACLREGVVADPDAVDAGMVYGTGFAPFLGGPMRYAEALGAAGVRESLTHLAGEYGARFKPDIGWRTRED